MRKAQTTQVKAVGEVLIDGEDDPTIDALVKRRIDAKGQGLCPGRSAAR